MKKEKEISIHEDCITFICGDIRLDIVAIEHEKDEWGLSIINSCGVRSTWLEMFESSAHAIEAGIQAIREEGIEEFTGIEGFEYLSEIQNDV